MTKEDLQTLEVGNILKARGKLYEVRSLKQNTHKQDPSKTITMSAHLAVIGDRGTSWVISTTGTEKMYSRIKLMTIEEYPEYYI